jgi:hypothetical protein
VRADDLAVGAAEVAQARDVFVDVEHVPGEAHEMVRLGAALG